MITHKADIEARDEENQTPLHDAALKNSTEVAQLLIAHKADIEARTSFNQTALHFAAENFSTEVTLLLISHKADVEARDDDNHTPLDVARISRNYNEAARSFLMKNMQTLWI